MHPKVCPICRTVINRRGDEHTAFTEHMRRCRAKQLTRRKNCTRGKLKIMDRRGSRG